MRVATQCQSTTPTKAFLPHQRVTTEGKVMEYELMRIAEFLSENWSKWESFCENNGDNAQEIYEEIGGEE